MVREQWLQLKQAAGIANVHPKTIMRAIAKGSLKRANNGVRRVLISDSDLRRWMIGGRLTGG